MSGFARYNMVLKWLCNQRASQKPARESCCMAAAWSGSREGSLCIISISVAGRLLVLVLRTRTPSCCKLCFAPV